MTLGIMIAAAQNCSRTADAFAGAAGNARHADNFQFYCSFLLFPGTNQE